MTRTRAVFLLNRLADAADPVEKARYEERVIAAMMYAPDERRGDVLDMTATLRAIESIGAAVRSGGEATRVRQEAGA